MKNKGFASSLIIFSLLTLFLITLFMLMNTLSNTSSLNNNVKKNIINELNYDESNSTSIENRLSALENKISTLEDKIYPVGSIYMSLTDETIESVTEKFGGTWEKYAQGRTLIGEGTSTDSNGLVQTFKANDSGGSMSKSGNYTPSGSISNYNGKSGDTALSIEQTPAGLARITYNSSNNWSLGVWASYGNGYTVTMKDQAGYGSYGSGHNHTINHSHTFTGTKSSISVAGLDPYVVTYMYRKISN